MNREQKQQKIDTYDDALTGAGYAILSEHGKMSVGKVEDMRSKLRNLGCESIVLKNTLARIVFERHGLEEVSEHLVGPSILMYGVEEIAPAAKLIQKLSKANPTLKIKAVVFDGKVYESKDFKTFTDMPTKQEIRAQLVGVMKAPIAGFVRVINTPQRIATVLKAYADKRAG